MTLLTFARNSAASSTRCAALLLIFAANLLPVLASAQDTAAGADVPKMPADMIPDDAIAAVFMSPSRTMKSPDWEMMPVEVVQAVALENLGIDPYHVDGITVMGGIPGLDGPVGGAIIEFNRDVAVESLKFIDELREGDYRGMKVYEIPENPPIRLHQLDARTWLVGVGGYVKRMADAKQFPKGKLAELATKINAPDGFTVIASLDLVGPMITGLLQSVEGQIPPPIKDVVKFAEWTDAVYINTVVAPLGGSTKISLLAKDADSAAKLETLINSSIDFGAQAMIASMQSEMDPSDPVQQSFISYMDRVSKVFTEAMRPKTNGTVVRMEINSSASVASTGVLVGLLLPAVQSARAAARRMSTSNNMKQIGLAMHNYHSAYKKLPAQAITDEDGEPLLSWRVAILPYIEEQALYERFHLDEPWNSPHNSKLIDEMPPVYESLNMVLPPGETVMQVPLSDKDAKEPVFFIKGRQARFRDVLDGLSNTPMVVQVNPQDAVTWTKPADWEVNLDNAKNGVGSAEPGGFHILLGDGAVIFISQSIDAKLWRDMLTRAGGEVIQREF